jgi:hypothetical protein
MTCHKKTTVFRSSRNITQNAIYHIKSSLYRMTQKWELFKNPTKIEEIQEKIIIDRN